MRGVLRPRTGKSAGTAATLREVLTRGALIVFSAGVLAFIVYTLGYILAGWWRPVVKSLTGSESSFVVVPLTLVFTALLVVVIGFAFSWKRLLDLFSRFAARVPVMNWFLGERRIPQSINDMPGALVRFTEGGYYIAALVGGQRFVSKSGEPESMYKLYCPSAPVPWSGLPIIFARPESVIILKLSFGEVYGITTSFGRSAPETLEEISLSDGLEPTPVEPGLLDGGSAPSAKASGRRNRKRQEER
jgi:uncharacterized membrane protein